MAYNSGSRRFLDGMPALSAAQLNDALANLNGDASTASIQALLATTRASLAQRFADMPNPLRDYGANGLGLADDTLPLRSLIANSPNEVRIPAGTFNLTDVLSITGAQTKIIGAGTQRTILVQTDPTADIFDWPGADGYMSGLTLAYAGTPDPSSVALNTSSTYGQFERLKFYNCANCIRQSGAGISQFYRGIVALNFSSSAFWVDGCSDAYLDHFIFSPGGLEGDATTGINGSIRLTGDVEAVVATNGDIFRGKYGLVTSSSTFVRGSCPAFCQFSNVYFDSSASIGGFLNQLLETEFIGCWFSGGRTPGAGEYGAQLTQTDGIKFVACKFIDNGSHGLVLNTGAARTLVSASSFNSNGVEEAAGTANGITVLAGVCDFDIQGSAFSNGIIPMGAGGGQQGYGVCILPGASDRYVVANNSMHGNYIGGLSDGGTGTNKVTGGNLV